MHGDGAMKKRNRLRAGFVLLHRYVGLVIAAFLVIAGLTGAPLVWYEELDEALNAEAMRVEPPADETQPLDPFELRERALAAWPGARIEQVSLDREPGEAASFWLDFAEDSDAPIDQVFIDPYTGEVLGSRLWGDIGQGLTNLMPFLLLLHYQLAIGTVGTLAFGIVALLWTLDCFVSAYLTFPRRRGSHRERGAANDRSWWARWRPAWLLRWRKGGYKLNFDLHRAGGLWLWAILFVFAWSSVGMNLAPVYQPVMNLFFEHQEIFEQAPEPSSGNVMSWEAALATGERLIDEAAEQEGFVVIRPDRIGFSEERRMFRYSVRTDRDMIRDWGGTTVYFDAVNGRRLGLYLPSGGAAGDTVTNWLYALHFGKVWGLWFRIFVTLAGLAVVMLSVTGVIIWWRKRKARRSASSRQERVRTAN